MKLSLKTIGFSLIGVIIALFLNYLLIEKLIIPESCYYHTHDTTFLFDLFYKLTPSEGFHPFPTKLNFLLTLITGAIIGLLIGLKVNLKKI